MHNFIIHLCKAAFCVFDLYWKRICFWSKKFSSFSGKRCFMSADAIDGLLQLLLFLLQVVSVIAVGLTLILMFIDISQYYTDQIPHSGLMMPLFKMPVVSHIQCGHSEQSWKQPVHDFWLLWLVGPKSKGQFYIFKKLEVCEFCAMIGSHWIKSHFIELAVI